jgi:hypothetical protein
MPILKIIGMLMIISVLAVGGYLFVNASKLEKEIEAEGRDQVKE